MLSDTDSIASPSTDKVEVSEDQSVLRVVECVRINMHFSVTKDKKFPSGYVIHSNQGSLVSTYDDLEKHFGGHPDAHENMRPRKTCARR